MTGIPIRGAQSVSSDQAASTQIRLQDIVEILRKRIWIAAVTTGLILSIAVVMLSQTTPQYRASAQLLLGEQGQVDARTSDFLEARVLSD
ncbi:MAG: Wzz/FepE/Etk N-terminal domain-containing protein, partial [Pseudomonadota bacterium]